MERAMYKTYDTNQKGNQKKMERKGENCDQKYKTICIKILVKIYYQWTCNYNEIAILPKP